LRSCLEHLRFRKHDISIFHLLDSQECDFRFQRRTRFVDMEGGPYVFADPQEIADRYQRAMQDHLAAVQNIMRETAVDYHRVRTDESYERFLMQFLIARHQGRGQR